MSQTTEIAPPAFLGGGTKKLLIGGAWVPARSGEVMDSINPSTGDVIGQIAAGGAEDVDLAVAAAREAFEGPWSAFTPMERQNLLLRFADLLLEQGDDLPLLDTYDMGRPAIGAGPYTQLVADIVRYYAGWPTKIHGATLPNSNPGAHFTYTLHQPIGVVASIMPWNVPFMMTLQKVLPVLATGCTMVLKPAEDASMTPLRIAELFEEVGLPPGVLNVVTGLGSTVGAALSSHPGVDKVSFTGSTATGQHIVRAAAGNLKRVSLELGGKSPDIVFADADLDKAAPAAALAVFGNTGQACTSGSRIFVERPIYDEFVERLAGFASTLEVGNSLDLSTHIGPLVSARQLERVAGYLEAGVQEGARVVVGGGRLQGDGYSAGYFVEPTVFADVEDGMRIAKEEIFGPVASVLPFDTFDEVVQRANSVEFGLAGGVWTRDLSKAHRMAHALASGMIWVNTYHSFDPSLPFSGAKMSGWGTEWGEDSLYDYLSTKSVWMDLNP